VSANASWDFILTRPVTLLPIVIILTLLIETYGIRKLNAIEKTRDVFWIVSIGNVISFVIPQLLNIFYVLDFTTKLKYQNEPLYSIALFYYVLTILVEMPIDYFLLRKKAISKKKLVFSILFVNLITTLLVFVAERGFMLLFWSAYL